MQIKKTPAVAYASPEHMVAQQAEHLAHKYKYKSLFADQSSPRQQYAYPPPQQSEQEGEMRILEHQMSKGGHGVPLSSEYRLLVSSW